MGGGEIGDSMVTKKGCSPNLPFLARVEQVVCQPFVGQQLHVTKEQNIIDHAVKVGKVNIENYSQFNAM